MVQQPFEWGSGISYKPPWCDKGRIIGFSEWNPYIESDEGRSLHLIRRKGISWLCHFCLCNVTWFTFICDLFSFVELTIRFHRLSSNGLLASNLGMGWEYIIVTLLIVLQPMLILYAPSFWGTNSTGIAHVLILFLAYPLLIDTSTYLWSSFAPLD